MNFRKLGRTGLTVSEIGFGTWGIGGNSYGETDDRVSIDALRAAFEAGITFYDTSNIYGAGKSEELLAQGLGDVRDRIIIASKAGMTDETGAQDFSPGQVVASVESSLKRLRTDYLDLLQLHSPSIKQYQEAEGLVEALDGLVKSGKARAYAVSVRSPEDSDFFVKNSRAGAIQLNFNLTDQRALAAGALELCAKHDVGVIVRTPLGFGFLVGDARDLNPGSKDHRARFSSDQRQVWSEAIGKFLNCASDGVRQTNAQLALRFCLSFPAVSTVIPGMLTRAQVIENVGASGLGAYSPQAINCFQRVYAENTFIASTKAKV